MEGRVAELVIYTRTAPTAAYWTEPRTKVTPSFSTADREMRAAINCVFMRDGIEAVVTRWVLLYSLDALNTLDALTALDASTTLNAS